MSLFSLSASPRTCAARVYFVDAVLLIAYRWQAISSTASTDMIWVGLYLIGHSGQNENDLFDCCDDDLF